MVTETPPYVDSLCLLRGVFGYRSENHTVEIMLIELKLDATVNIAPQMHFHCNVDGETYVHKLIFNFLTA